MKPLGNLLFDGGVSIRGVGLGPLLSGGFSDESLLDLLKSYCQAPQLIALQQCSKALYILANEEELWRSLALERWAGDFRFVQDWKNTYAHMWRREQWRNKQQLSSGEAANTADATSAPATSSASATSAAAAASAAPVVASPPLATDTSMPEFALLPAPLKFAGFYSDFLFQSFYCSHIDLLSSYGDAHIKPSTAAGGAAAAPLDTIPRVHISQLSSADFRRDYGTPNRPLIIQGLMDSWPCFAPGPDAWNVENWSRKYANQPFKIGRFSMPLHSYFKYMQEVSTDESPLYLFDSRFGEKCPDLLKQYEVPEFFTHDLFNLIPEQEKSAEGEKVRPAFRWILVGPARSGSTFHKDPNHTSAWNALISGRKKWFDSLAS